MTLTDTDIAIVGAGHAGAQCAIALRQDGFSGSIALIGDEPDPPYERPPLSKEYLAGERPFERMLIRPATFWSERAIDLIPAQVAAVDPVAHRLTTTNGGRIAYRRLVWAAGGRARRLACPGGDADNILTIRTRADVDRLTALLTIRSRRVAIVGGGYIGLEAAAVLTKQGHAVTLLEAMPRILARVTGPALAGFMAAEHRAHGVDLHTGATVTTIDTANGQATGVRLTNGAHIPCDLIIAGIGIVAAVGPLLTAGAAGGDGVDVDAHCRTTLPDVHAIGDCAAHANRFAGGTVIRLESVQNAHDMAKVAAADLTGRPVTYDAVPWFWSNQYDLRLQMVGLSAGYDRCVVRGDPASRSFSCAYLKAGRLIALDAVNRTRDYAQARALIEAGARPDPARLADADIPLKTLAD